MAGSDQVDEQVSALVAKLAALIGNESMTPEEKEQVIEETLVELVTNQASFAKELIAISDSLKAIQLSNVNHAFSVQLTQVQQELFITREKLEKINVDELIDKTGCSNMIEEALKNYATLSRLNSEILIAVKSLKDVDEKQATIIEAHTKQLQVIDDQFKSIDWSFISQIDGRLAATNKMIIDEIAERKVEDEKTNSEVAAIKEAVFDKIAPAVQTNTNFLHDMQKKVKSMEISVEGLESINNEITALKEADKKHDNAEEELEKKMAASIEAVNDKINEVEDKEDKQIIAVNTKVNSNAKDISDLKTQIATFDGLKEFAQTATQVSNQLNEISIAVTGHGVSSSNIINEKNIKALTDKHEAEITEVQGVLGTMAQDIADLKNSDKEQNEELKEHESSIKSNTNDISELKAAVSDVSDKVTNVYSSKEVDEAIAGAIEPYITENEANDTFATKEALKAYITSDNAQQTYLSQADAKSTYAAKTDLNNYRTETASDMLYASKAELAKAEKDIADIYATKQELDTHITEADQKYATKEDLNDIVKTQELDQYAEKDQVYSKETADDVFMKKEGIQPGVTADQIAVLSANPVLGAIMEKFLPKGQNIIESTGCDFAYPYHYLQGSKNYYYSTLSGNLYRKESVFFDWLSRQASDVPDSIKKIPAILGLGDEQEEVTLVNLGEGSEQTIPHTVYLMQKVNDKDEFVKHTLHTFSPAHEFKNRSDITKLNADAITYLWETHDVGVGCTGLTNINLKNCMYIFKCNNLFADCGVNKNIILPGAVQIIKGNIIDDAVITAATDYFKSFTIAKDGVDTYKFNTQMTDAAKAALRKSLAKKNKVKNMEQMNKACDDIDDLLANLTNPYTLSSAISSLKSKNEYASTSKQIAISGDLRPHLETLISLWNKAQTTDPDYIYGDDDANDANDDNKDQVNELISRIIGTNGLKLKKTDGSTNLDKFSLEDDASYKNTFGAVEGIVKDYVQKVSEPSYTKYTGAAADNDTNKTFKQPHESFASTYQMMVDDVDLSGAAKEYFDSIYGTVIYTPGAVSGFTGSFLNDLEQNEVLKKFKSLSLTMYRVISKAGTVIPEEKYSEIEVEAGGERMTLGEALSKNKALSKCYITANMPDNMIPEKVFTRTNSLQYSDKNGWIWSEYTDDNKPKGDPEQPIQAELMKGNGQAAAPYEEANIASENALIVVFKDKWNIFNMNKEAFAALKKMIETYAPKIANKSVDLTKSVLTADTTDNTKYNADSNTLTFKCDNPEATTAETNTYAIQYVKAAGTTAAHIYLMKYDTAASAYQAFASAQTISLNENSTEWSDFIDSDISSNAFAHFLCVENEIGGTLVKGTIAPTQWELHATLNTGDDTCYLKEYLDANNKGTIKGEVLIFPQASVDGTKIISHGRYAPTLAATDKDYMFKLSLPGDLFSGWKYVAKPFDTTGSGYTAIYGSNDKDAKYIRSSDTVPDEMMKGLLILSLFSYLVPKNISDSLSDADSVMNGFFGAKKSIVDEYGSQSVAMITDYAKSLKNKKTIDVKRFYMFMKICAFLYKNSNAGVIPSPELVKIAGDLKKSRNWAIAWSKIKKLPGFSLGYLSKKELDWDADYSDNPEELKEAVGGLMYEVDQLGLASGDMLFVFFIITILIICGLASGFSAEDLRQKSATLSIIRKVARYLSPDGDSDGNPSIIPNDEVNIDFTGFAIAGEQNTKAGVMYSDGENTLRFTFKAEDPNDQQGLPAPITPKTEGYGTDNYTYVQNVEILRKDYPAEGRWLVGITLAYAENSEMKTKVITQVLEPSESISDAKENYDADEHPTYITISQATCDALKTGDAFKGALDNNVITIYAIDGQLEGQFELYRAAVAEGLLSLFNIIACNGVPTTINMLYFHYNGVIAHGITNWKSYADSNSGDYAIDSYTSGKRTEDTIIELPAFGYNTDDTKDKIEANLKLVFLEE